MTDRGAKVPSIEKIAFLWRKKSCAGFWFKTVRNFLCAKNTVFLMDGTKAPRSFNSNFTWVYISQIESLQFTDHAKPICVFEWQKEDDKHKTDGEWQNYDMESLLNV